MGVLETVVLMFYSLVRVLAVLKLVAHEVVFAVPNVVVTVENLNSALVDKLLQSHINEVVCCLDRRLSDLLEEVFLLLLGSLLCQLGSICRLLLLEAIHLFLSLHLVIKPLQLAEAIIEVEVKLFCENWRHLLFGNVPLELLPIALLPLSDNVLGYLLVPPGQSIPLGEEVPQEQLERLGIAAID